MISLKFYVYAYLHNNGIPYYVGKGHEKRAWSKHTGISVPTDLKNIVLLEQNLTELGAFALERRYIRWYGREDLGTGILHNRTDGGDGATGKRGPQKAPRSAEHKAKLAEATRKRMEDPEIRKSISMSLKGTVFSEERKAKLCGRKQSPETIAKRINKNTGKKRTPEQIERLRQGNLGKKRTPEQIEKIRQGAILGNVKRKERELLNVS